MRSNQIRHISILRPVVLFVRLGDRTLKDVATDATEGCISPATATSVTRAATTVIVVLGRRSRGAGPRDVVLIAVPRNVGEVVLVEDGHFGSNC